MAWPLEHSCSRDPGCNDEAEGAAARCPQLRTCLRAPPPRSPAPNCMVFRPLLPRQRLLMLHPHHWRQPQNVLCPVSTLKACRSQGAAWRGYRHEPLPAIAPAASASRQVTSRQLHLNLCTAASTSNEVPADIKLPDYCPGCGIKLQFEDATQPGYARLPRSFEEDIDLFKDVDEGWQQAEGDQDRNGIPSTGSEASTSASPASHAPDTAYPIMKIDDDDGTLAELDRAVEAWVDDDVEGRKQQHQLQVEEPPDTGTPRVVCQRCHSLTHYGKVQNPEAEGLLPEFDLARRVGRKIALQKHRRAIVLCVVDVVDFDGSLPRAAVAAMLPWNRDPGTETPGVPLWDLVVAANKADLLPPCPKLAVENWARARTVQAGLPRPREVHAVSSHKDTGVRDLLAALHRVAGGRGDIWVVGAQNAGKSSLINAMRRSVQRDAAKRTTITTAALPGTTLSVLRVDGLMGPGCRMFDTPGVPHSHQLTSLLTLPELALVQPKRRLQARTFRIQPEFSIMVGGSARVDVLASPSRTLYLTAYASMSVPCYMARTSKLESKLDDMVGSELVPPNKLKNREHEWQALQPCTLSLQGNSWRRHSKDIAFAGLGWVAVGLEGEASFRAWAPPGIAVTTRDAIMPKFAEDFQRPGLGLRDKGKLPKAVKKSAAVAA